MAPATPHIRIKIFQSAGFCFDNASGTFRAIMRLEWVQCLFPLSKLYLIESQESRPGAGPDVPLAPQAEDEDPEDPDELPLYIQEFIRLKQPEFDN
jgi:hypothetical protein